MLHRIGLSLGRKTRSLQKGGLPASKWHNASMFAVMACQILYLAGVYLDAWFEGSLPWDKIHISAVLDHERRASFAASIAILSTVSMFVLEWTRSLVLLRSLRLGLALSTGLGIFAVSVIRESHSYFLHCVFTVVAFSAAVILVTSNSFFCVCLPLLLTIVSTAHRSGWWP